MTILPLAYLGSVDYFGRLATGDCVIDIGERWVKQTARNRAEILTANGVAALTVPVHGGSGKGEIAAGADLRTKDVRIDNSKRWQHTHWMSIVSAYRNSPYFDHYEERFAPVYSKKIDFLTDLNLELLEILTSALRLDGAVKISENHLPGAPGDIDLRGKKSLRRVDVSRFLPTDGPGLGEYTQVFSDRMPFIPGLSIVDLLFCEGPSAQSLIRDYGGGVDVD